MNCAGKNNPAGSSKNLSVKTGSFLRGNMIKGLIFFKSKIYPQQNLKNI